MGFDFKPKSDSALLAQVESNTTNIATNSSQLAETTQSKFSISNIITLRKFLKTKPIWDEICECYW